jgi:hypothetical protein
MDRGDFKLAIQYLTPVVRCTDDLPAALRLGTAL